MRLLSWIILGFCIIAEGVITTMPLTLLFLLCLTVMKRQEWVFPVAFSAGIILDVFSLRTLGITSLYFVSFMFLLLLYQRKYETATMPFVCIAAFFGSIGYLMLTGQQFIFLQAILSSGIAALAFAVYRSIMRSSTDSGFQKV